jgi:LacI family transcriptional regulator
MPEKANEQSGLDHNTLHPPGGRAGQPMFRSADQPYYQQLRDDLLTRIQRGEFGPSGRLPSYARICREYHVSEITARKAVDRLCVEGHVYTQKGRGIFVKQDRRRCIRLLLPYGMRSRGDQHQPNAFVLLDLYDGVREAAESLGVDVRIHSHVSRPPHGQGWIELAGLDAADGLLFLHEMGFQHELAWAAHEGRPYVIAEGLSEQYNRVWIDMEAGCFDMVRYLVGAGHRRIAFLTGLAGNPWYPPRLRGYRRGLEEAGITPDPALIRETSGYDPVEDDAAVSAWLQMRDRPTAIFAANDLRALHVLDYLKLRGHRVPEDISVAGYDNAPASGENKPALTTVDAPRRQAAARAVAELCKLFDNPQRRVNRRLGPTLVVRDSVAPVS